MDGPINQINEVDYCKDYQIERYSYYLVPVSAIWVAALSILMIKKRKLYPIKQMSVILSVSSLIVLYLYYLYFIIFCFIKENDEKLLAFIIDFYGNFTIFSFVFIEIMKQVRQVGITINKLEEKFIRFIKRETLTLFICFGISLFITSISITIRYLNNREQYNLYIIMDNNYSLYKPIAMYIMQITTIIALYLLRNTKYHYKENVQLFIFLIVSYAFIILSSINKNNDYNQKYGIYFLGWAFFLIFTLLQYALPLYKSRTFHSCLTQSDILNSFETFIKVEMCVDIFAQFLCSPSQIKRQIESVNQIICSSSNCEGNKQKLYFYFCIKYQLDQQNNELSQDFARSTFSFYNAESNNVFTSIHNCEAEIEKYFLTSKCEPDRILLFYYELAKDQLQTIYQSEFTKTNSFATIQKMLLINDQIENNRNKFGMTDL